MLTGSRYIEAGDVVVVDVMVVHQERPEQARYLLSWPLCLLPPFLLLFFFLPGVVVAESVGETGCWSGRWELMLGRKSHIGIPPR